MRIAALVYQFPVLSQTFVLNQITGLLERGQSVEIFAARRGDENAAHPDVARFQLGAHTTYYDLSPNYFARAARALPIAARAFRDSPVRALAAMNVPRYGMHAASLQLLSAVNALRAHEPFDITHGHFGPNGLLGAKLRDIGALRGKLVTTFYGYDVSETRHVRAYDFLFARGDLFLALSETMRARLIEMGCAAQKIRVHHLGIDPALFSPAPRAPRSEIRLLTIARLVPKKGIEYALRAVARVRERFPNLRYVIVGDGVLRPALEKLIVELRLQNCVQLAGWQTQPRVIEFLQNSDILLAPSITAPNGDAEGTPVAVLEAMAMELAVLATRHSALPEMLTHKVSGWLVPERDVDALAGALETLGASETLRTRLGKNARAVVSTQFNIHTLNDGLLDLYTSL